MLAALGINQADLLNHRGIAFMVRRVEANYFRPARLGDDLTVATAVTSVRPASLIMEQDIRRDDVRLFAAKVVVAVIGGDGRPTRIPPDCARRLRESHDRTRS